MASYNQNTIILTLMICSLMVFTEGANNDTLINEMCSKTYVPNVCISCINSDAKDAKTDVDVINQMLGCLLKDANTFENDVNNALKDVKFNSDTKEALEYMNPDLLLIIDEVNGKLQRVVASRNFSDARVRISNNIFKMLEGINTVISTSVNKSIVIPPPIFSGIFNVEADTKLSDQLIASVSVKA